MDPISNYTERESIYIDAKAQAIRNYSYDHNAYTGYFAGYLLRRAQEDDGLPLIFPLLQGNISLIFDQVFENRMPFTILKQQLNTTRSNPMIILTGSRRSQFPRMNYENRTIEKRMKAELPSETIDLIKNEAIDFSELVTATEWFKTDSTITEDNRTELKLWLFPERNLIFGTFMVDKYIDNSNFDNNQTQIFHRTVLRILAICQSLFSASTFQTGLQEDFIEQIADNFLYYCNHGLGTRIREEWTQYRDILGIQNSKTYIEGLYDEFQKRLIKVKKDKISNLENTYEQTLFALDTVLQQLRDAETRLLDSDDPEKKQDFINAVNNENIRKIQFNGLELVMDIETPARLNEDDVRNYLIGLPRRYIESRTKNTLKVLLEGYLNKDFKFYFMGRIKGNLNTEAERRNLMIEGTSSPISSKMQAIPNTHLKHARCLGSNGPELIRALSEKNWIGFINQAIYTVGQLNVVDSGIIDIFMHEYLMSGDIYLHFPDGKVIPLLEYVKTKGESNEDQTPETN